MNAALETAVDSHNPWLGLSSFTEETRAYFFGRDEEVAEVARRVQRKLLTVLFGQSGLGKTSILRAGLVPKLRTQGYCPVYVRIDYDAKAPEPADQIKQAVAQAARGAGEWTQVGVAAGGESLWEFLHHRDDVLRDATGKTLIPLIIFDQFEEIFTLAQSDEAGRARAARFVADLSDLVENRPPKLFEERLEQDERAAERFDFARSDYRVLIALREDYLAPLEGLKRSMPSLSQNRLRLAPMTGRQALIAVTGPGKGLVNEEVAAAIVRFVAGGAELQNAEIEPALLSLVCRELNDARLSAGRAEISADLLEGSQDTILSNFYERSLADQPPAVRRIIEDQLLTASGYRENIAEERLAEALRTAGAPAVTLSVLVNRRLLRVEERLDLRRVELTHDVLCGVVKASRDLRQERESREAADRLLAEQRDKETAARKALVRARQIATACALLAVVAVAALVVAVMSTLRARRVETATQQARVQAEALVGYLADDFTRELYTYGQTSTVADIARRQIDYFHGLPASLKDFNSIRNAAAALTALSRAERNLGHLPSGEATGREAIALLEQARNDGDTSDATTLALGRAYGAVAQILDSSADPQALVLARQEIALLEPLVTKPDASPTARRALANALSGYGFLQQQHRELWDDALQTLARSREISASLGAREVSSPDVTALYVGAAVWEEELLSRLGHEADSRALAEEADALCEKVLIKRPDYIGVLHDAQILEIDLAQLANVRLDPAAAVELAQRALDKSRRLLQRDPDNASSINNASVNAGSLSDFAWAKGDPATYADYVRQAEALYHRVADAGTWFVLNRLNGASQVTLRLADARLDAEARALADDLTRSVAALQARDEHMRQQPAFVQCGADMAQGALSYGREDFRRAQQLLHRARMRVDGLKPLASHESFLQLNCEYYGATAEGDAQLALGDNAAALESLQAAVAAKKKFALGGTDEQRTLVVTQTLKAMALARLGRSAEARSLIEPQVAFERELAARNHGDVTQFLELAQALYVQSLADPAHAAALRREALGLIDPLPAPYRALRSVTRWRALIQKP